MKVNEYLLFRILSFKIVKSGYYIIKLPSNNMEFIFPMKGQITTKIPTKMYHLLFLVANFLHK